MSRFVGQLGKYITTKVKVIDKIHRSSWKDKERYLYILSDTDGNIITVSVPSSTLQKGEEWLLSGRVKAHNEFRGMAQTHCVKWSMAMEG